MTTTIRKIIHFEFSDEGGHDGEIQIDTDGAARIASLELTVVQDKIVYQADSARDLLPVIDMLVDALREAREQLVELL